MKNIIKVFNIITIVLNAIAIAFYLVIACIFFFGGGAIIIESINESTGGEVASIPFFVYGIYFLLLALPSILPIVFAAISNKKLTSAKSKNDLLIWGILCLVFANTISGVLMLIISDDQLNETNLNTSSNKEEMSTNKEEAEEEFSVESEPEEVAPTAKKDFDNSLEQLKRLKKLLDDGTITLEEYNECKESIIKKM
jgi:hypothetical protein